MMKGKVFCGNVKKHSSDVNIQMYSVQSKESCIKVSFRTSGVFCQIVHTPACIGRTFSQELKLYLLNVLKNVCLCSAYRYGKSYSKCKC